MDQMKKLFILYAGIIMICIVSIGAGVYAEFFQEDNRDHMDVIGNLVGKQESEEDVKTDLINQFDQIFINAIKFIDSAREVEKIEEAKEIVYALQDFTKQEPLLYDIDIHIPTLNIKSKAAEEINKEIEETFTQKAIDIVNKKEIYTIYHVSYVSYIHQDILSLVIRATLKEGDKAQRVILYTYNYNMQAEKQITLKDLIAEKELTESEVQTIIDEQIKKFNEEDAGLTALGHEGFSRNLNDKQYKIANTTTYFLGEEEYLYILYPYGNKEDTSQIDIILF